MRIYFDHNATTPPHPEVLKAQAEAAALAWANPSSLHTEGRGARHAVELARKQVAALIRAKPEEIIFTSGGTEANNLAVLGTAQALERMGIKKPYFVSSLLEHPSVKVPLGLLEEQGWPIERLSIDTMGRLDLYQLEQILHTGKVKLVTLSLCNHELGNIYPLEQIVTLCHQYDALVHCDAVQAVGRFPVHVNLLPVDLLTFTSHKLYGPKGTGALFCRSQLGADFLSPGVMGGQQERGRRAGTENVLSIVGFGKACQLAEAEMESRIQVTSRLRDRLETKLLAIPLSRLHGDPNGRASGTCNIGFEGVEGELLMASLDLEGIAVSTGAACSSGSLEPSSVLLSLGLTKVQAQQGVRFSMGYENTIEEVDQVVEKVNKAVIRIRSISNHSAA